MVSVDNEYGQFLTNLRPARKLDSLELLLPYISFKDSFEYLEAREESISSLIFMASFHFTMCC